MAGRPGAAFRAQLGEQRRQVAAGRAGAFEQREEAVGAGLLAGLLELAHRARQLGRQVFAGARRQSGGQLAFEAGIVERGQGAHQAGPGERAILRLLNLFGQRQAVAVAGERLARRRGLDFFAPQQQRPAAAHRMQARVGEAFAQDGHRFAVADAVAGGEQESAPSQIVGRQRGGETLPGAPQPFGTRSLGAGGGAVEPAQRQLGGIDHLGVVREPLQHFGERRPPQLVLAAVREFVLEQAQLAFAGRHQRKVFEGGERRRLLARFAVGQRDRPPQPGGESLVGLVVGGELRRRDHRPQALLAQAHRAAPRLAGPSAVRRERRHGDREGRRQLARGPAAGQAVAQLDFGRLAALRVVGAAGLPLVDVGAELAPSSARRWSSPPAPAATPSTVK